MDDLGAIVKLFNFTSENTWQDLGIYSAFINEVSIELINENNEIEYKFDMEMKQIRRQDEYIISWVDYNENQYGISFKDGTKASSFWQHLEQIQRIKKEKTYIPEPKYENIDEILIQITTSEAIQLIQNNWLNNLCEEAECYKENNSALMRFFPIFQKLLNYANFGIIEGLLTNAHYLAVFLVIEADSESCSSFFEGYFNERANFLNILNIEDPDFIDKINLNQRLICLRDCMYNTRFTDEARDTISCFIFKVWNSLILEFANMEDTRDKLNKILTENDKNSYFLIREIIKNCTNVSDEARASFFNYLNSSGILKTILKALRNESLDIEIRKIAIETFSVILRDDAKIVFLLFNESKAEVFSIFKTSLVCEIEIFQICCKFIKEFITSDYFIERDGMFVMFSEKVLALFINELPILLKNSEKFEYVEEILSVVQESIRTGICGFKFTMIKCNFNARLCTILEICKKAIQISAIQLVKQEIASNDNALIMNLLESNTISAVISVLISLKTEDMLYSCCLSLLKLIKSSEKPKLINKILELIKKPENAQVYLIYESLIVNKNIQIDANEIATSEIEIPYPSPVYLGKRQNRTTSDSYKKLNLNEE